MCGMKDLVVYDIFNDLSLCCLFSLWQEMREHVVRFLVETEQSYVESLRRILKVRSLCLFSSISNFQPHFLPLTQIFPFLAPFQFSLSFKGAIA